MIRYQDLLKIIDDSGMTKVHIAKMLEIHENTLDLKLSGQTQFRANELYVLKQILHLSDEVFIFIFFNNECDKKSHLQETA